MPRDIIELSNVVKKFGDFTAVDGISLSVKEGEIFGLLGPNGAGKTTTINMLLGLLTQTSGTIKIDGMDMKHNSEAIKQSMGLMTQETVVDGDLTAVQNLDIFAELYNMGVEEKEKAIQHALEEANLLDFKDEKAGSFSGGMQRRLNLVKSMLHNPHILVLDEPTTGLDVQNRVSMWEDIRKLNRNGVTVILTTQYLEEADSLCNRIAIIDHGEIKALGTPSELKKMVTEGSVIDVSLKFEDIEKASRVIEAKLGVRPRVVADRLSLNVKREDIKTLSSVISILEKEKIPIISIAMHLPTLDDVFIKLTGATIRDTLGEQQSAASKVMWRRR
ncbi:MAG: ATP-binding cassette domain-containing protein [Candidatus Marsarchaeota archaeon]|nr:ATP-binding cassette domain-containing protein [Candidatus Marsarchaeota archaeon]